MRERIRDNQVKLWTSDLIKTMMVSFFAGISANMHMATSPLFAQQIGGNKSVAGLMMGVFTLSALFTRPLFGNQVDRCGRKAILLTGVILCAFSSLAYNVAYAAGLLVIVRFIHGVGFSAYTTAAGTIVSDVVPKSRLMEGIGYFGAANVLATAIGPALGLYLVSYMNYFILNMTTLTLSTFGLVFAVLIKYEHKTKHKDAIPAKGILLEKTSMRPASVMFFIALAQGGIISFLPSYAIFRGIHHIDMFFVVYAVALIITRPFTGKLADRIGAAKVLLPGMLLLVLALVILSFASSLPLFLLCGVLYGWGYGTVLPVINAVIIKICPDDHKGSGNAAFYASLDAGIGIGSIVWGFVADRAGFPVIYIASAGCVIVSFLLFIKIKEHCMPLNIEAVGSAEVQLPEFRNSSK